MRTPLERILVSLDGSSRADGAIEAIRPLLRRHQPEVILLGVMDEVQYSYELREHLDRVCDDLRAGGIDSSIVIREGSPSAEIVAIARERGVDLIAMSTHGRGGLARAFLGSVTEEVLRRTEVPILVCRPGVRMGDWKHLVVALDGSAAAERILPEVARFAKAEKASVDLVRVAVPVVTSGGLGEVPVVYSPEDPMPYLRKVAGELMANGVDARPVGLEGRIGPQILKHVTESDAALVVLTTHGRTGLSRILMGSVAEEIVRHAPCPVMIRRVAEAPKLVEKI